MYKFLFAFSGLVFLACLVLFIMNIGEAVNWITLTVAVLGMVSAGLSIWNWKMLQKLKG